jgi:hypothetical protein
MTDTWVLRATEYTRMKFLESAKPMTPKFPNNFIGEDPRISDRAGLPTSGTAHVAFAMALKAIGHE